MMENVELIVFIERWEYLYEMRDGEYAMEYNSKTRADTTKLFCDLITISINLLIMN